MKRQAEAVASRVYTYGCVSIAPVVNEDLALRQMRLGTRFWNLLVAIDRAQRSRYRRIVRDARQERLDDIHGEMQSLRDQIKARRKEARSRQVDDVGGAQAQLLALRREASELVSAIKATRDVMKAQRREEIQAANHRTRRRILAARRAAASVGLFWCNVDAIQQRADAGRKLGELKFRGFRGTGTISTRTKELRTDDVATRGHTFFRLDAAVPEQKWRYACLRIGSFGRNPLWLKLPIVYHRELPQDSQIVSVSATRRRIAARASWQLQITVSYPKPVIRTGSRAIALDVGWRLLPSGVRVAYWYDGNKHGEVVVPSNVIRQFEQVRELCSACDSMRGEFLPQLASWASRAATDIQAQAAHLEQWRSNDRIADFIRAVFSREAEARFVAPGDAKMYWQARAWRKQYLHLANWRRNLLNQLGEHVNYHYHQFAAALVKDYDVLILEDFDLRQVASAPAPESDVGIRGSGRYRQMVSPSVLRQVLSSTCAREGVRIVKQSAAYTTRRCHLDGMAIADKAADSVIVRYACGHVFDQDFVAAVNLWNGWQNSQIEGDSRPFGNLRNVVPNGGAQIPSDSLRSGAPPESACSVAW